jgi:hypothetical protein
VHDAQDSIAGGLGLFRGYGYFFAQQTIEEGGFSDIGSPCDGDVAGFEIIVCVGRVRHFYFTACCAQDAEAAEIISFFCFPLRGRKTKDNPPPASNIQIISTSC